MAGTKTTLSPSIMDYITPLLQEKQISTVNPRMINEKMVEIDILYAGDLIELQDELIVYLHPLKIDVAVLPKKNRRKKLLIADMDSTMIKQECIDELADYAGKKKEVASVTESAMQGNLNFEESLIARVAHLKGLPISVLQKCYDERIELMDGSLEMMAYMQEHKIFTALVSGGFTFFVEQVTKRLGFHAFRANTLLSADSVLTGKVQMPILGRDAKKTALIDYAKMQNIDLADTMAVGDGANDLSMLMTAGLGVAYHAKPNVAAQARVAIHFADLTALKYLQG